MIGILEGISYLVLLFIAMPIKYIEAFGGNPTPVKVVGMAHGVLFVAFVLWVLLVGRMQRWRFKRYAAAAVASVLPFGTFVFDRTLKHEQLDERPAQPITPT